MHQFLLTHVLEKLSLLSTKVDTGITLLLFCGPTMDGIWAKNSIGENSHCGEEATRNLLLFSGPGIKAQHCSSPVSLLDIYPTLIDICGISEKSPLEGSSLKPLLVNAQHPWERPAISTLGYKNHSVRTKRWRYISYSNGTQELYDHSKDPMEHNNLSNDPNFAETIKSLHKWLPQKNAVPSPKIQI